MRLVVLILALAYTGGCDDDETPPPSASASVSVTSSAPAPSPSGPYRDEDLIVPPDFEQEAEKAITPGNYKGKLAEIEAELGMPAASASADAGPP